MGSPQSWHRNKHIAISLFFLFVSSFIHVRSIAEGRAIPTPLMEATKVEAAPSSSPKLLEKVEMIRSQIGSRPPNCRRRCRDCGGHCEAVQVPVALHDSHQNQKRRRSSHFSAAVAKSAGASENNISLASEDETSNYKPISWKCKCGNFIFNP